MSEKRVEDSLRKGANIGQEDGRDPQEKVTRIDEIIVTMTIVTMIIMMMIVMTMIVVTIIIVTMIVMMMIVQEFCIDVSSYSPVTWVKEEVEECATHFTRSPPFKIFLQWHRMTSQQKC